MTELGNKQNNGWYGRSDKAKYKFEIAAIDNHYIPWIEDAGITEYYIKNWQDIDKYAEAHNLSDNNKRKMHTYRKIKNNYISDEKKKGLNSLRLIEAMDKAGAFIPLYRNDKDVELLQKLIAHRFNMVHSHIIRRNE